MKVYARVFSLDVGGSYPLNTTTKHTEKVKETSLNKHILKRSNDCHLHLGTMNPLMMIPHSYKIRKIHPNDHPNTTMMTIRYTNFQENQSQLYCHSPSKNPNPTWTKDVKAFIQSGQVEDYDGLCWCD